MSPSVDVNSAPGIGVQIGLARESLLNETTASMIDQSRNQSIMLNENTAASNQNMPPKAHMRKSPEPNETSGIMNHLHDHQQQHHHVTFQSSELSSKNENQQQQQPQQNTSIQSLKNTQATVSSSKINHNYNHTHQEVNYITEEMQLKAAYELQVWKETREREFEQEVSNFFFKFCFLSYVL
jgi:hypothetical protein